MEVREHSSVRIDGRKMAYDEVSPTEPRGTILLLTGLASKRLGWQRQLETFGRHYRTIALDHRDTGDSDPVAEPYTIGDLADGAAAVLRALGVDRATSSGSRSAASSPCSSPCGIPSWSTSWCWSRPRPAARRTSRPARR